MERTYRCRTCGKEEEYMEEYFSLGITAGHYCSEECWQASGYRDEGPEGFDPADAGEAYWEDEY